MFKMITLYMVAAVLLSSSMAHAIKDEDIPAPIAAMKQQPPHAAVEQQGQGWSPVARRKCAALGIAVVSTIFGMYLQNWLYPQQCFMHPYGTRIYWSGGLRPA